MNANEVRQLTLVGHGTVTTWRMYYVQISFKLYSHIHTLMVTKYVISDAAHLYKVNLIQMVFLGALEKNGVKIDKQTNNNDIKHIY